MARIRTIKPEFYTSEDVITLSAFARLLYIALWCEADREGRFVWKPITFKMRYFPVDNIDIDALCQELLDVGLVVLYGDGLAHIPTFAKHQRVNPRESQSTLPDPHAVKAAKSTRAPKELHASPEIDASEPTRENLDLHAQVGRERKGKERKGKEGKKINNHSLIGNGDEQIPGTVPNGKPFRRPPEPKVRTIPDHDEDGPEFEAKRRALIAEMKADLAREVGRG